MKVGRRRPALDRRHTLFRFGELIGSTRPPLFGLEQHRRWGTDGPDSRRKAGGNTPAEDDQRRRREHSPVVRHHFVEQRRHCPAGGRGRDQTGYRTHDYGAHPLPERHAENAPSGGAEGHTDRDLAAPALDRRRHHAVDAQTDEQVPPGRSRPSA